MSDQEPQPNTSSAAAAPDGVDLDRALRRDARRRREQIRQVGHRVGHYPPRHELGRAAGGGSAARDSAGGVIGRVGPAGRWGLAGAGLAAALGLAVVLSDWGGGGSVVDPGEGLATRGPGQVDDSTRVGGTGWTRAPAVAADWSRGVLRGMDVVQRDVGRGVGPALAGASGLTGRLERWPVWLEQAEAQVQTPLRSEWTALRADWATARDYVMARWRTEGSPASDAGPAAAWPGSSV